MKTKRQFILDTLLPYKKNRSLCGYEDGNCLYLTDDGRKCAVGKHMLVGDWQSFEEGFYSLCKSFDKEEFFTDEALEMNLSDKCWSIIQSYHDTLSMNSVSFLDSNNSIVTELEQETGLKFPELRVKKIKKRLT